MFSFFFCCFSGSIFLRYFLHIFFEDLIIVIAADGGGGGGRPFGLGGIVAAVCDCDAGCDDVKLVGALFDAFKSQIISFS